MAEHKTTKNNKLQKKNCNQSCCLVYSEFGKGGVNLAQPLWGGGGGAQTSPASGSYLESKQTERDAAVRCHLRNGLLLLCHHSVLLIGHEQTS